MSEQTAKQSLQVDPRGLRFAAGVTTVVLALTLVLNSPWPLAVQAVVFAISVAFGVQASPYGLLFKRLIRPRLGPPRSWRTRPRRGSPSWSASSSRSPV